MKAINVKVEYLNNPIGIDILSPRIMWNDEGGKFQSAFQIKAYTKGKIIYDSNKINSSSMHFDFPIEFESRQRVDFEIILWDENNVQGEVVSSYFEMGLLNKKDWIAKWIKGSYKAKKNVHYPVDHFKKEFLLKDIKQARLYITSCGLYETYINNQRVGEFVFAPGSTDYHKRIQYQTYDVISFLKEGENKIEIELADGFYRGSNGAKGRMNTYGTITKVIGQLEIIHSNGEKEIIITDSSWKWSNDGSVFFADLKDGEKIDANKIPSYRFNAKEVKFDANLTSSNNVEVKEHEHLKGKEVFKSKTNNLIIDLKQNISGYISFKINAHKGDTISFKLGELLDEDNNVTLKNVQCTYKGKKTPLQEIHYICKEGENVYKTKFFYGGFRYIQVTASFDINPNDIEAIALYSDFEITSNFECSNNLINQTYLNTLWSLKSNSTDIPSDCPTRERMGWTGDSQIFFNTASYMTNYASFARKHVRDIFDRQWKSGRLPQIAPFANEDWFMWVMNGSVGWACAGVYIPLYFYQKYGDDRLLRQYYDQIIKYALFMIKRAGKWGGIYAKHVKISHKNRKYFVNAGQSYGEWAEPNDVCAFVWHDFASPHPEESTAYTYFTLNRVLQIASILNIKEDDNLKKIKEYSQGAKIAYQEFVTTKGNTLDTNRQAKLVRPLYMGLLNEEQEKYAKERLIKALDNYSWRLGTGFLSTPLILDVLCSIDVKYAYKLLENEEMPGWLYMPKVGATTIWEAWEGDSTPSKGIASLNHYSKGAVCEWLMNSMCGIKIARENYFEIKPLVGGSITYAKGSYLSIYGKVTSSWKIKDNKVIYKVSLPPNTKGKMIINDEEKDLSSGEYEFIVDKQN